MAKTKAKPQARRKSGYRFVALAALAGVAAVVAIGILVKRHSRPSSTVSVDIKTKANTNDDVRVFAGYGTSPSCKACHEEAYQSWLNSHHGLAERPFDPSLDAAGFQTGKVIHHGTQKSEARMTAKGPELITSGLNGEQTTFPVERVLGVHPLKQFMISAPGGRMQVSELALDPVRGDWFDVYGAEDRKPGEWGHWTGRGMTWNSMCAACHNTRLRKNYDAEADTYATTMAEMGVGCESCHGPMAEHNRWQAEHPKGGEDPTIRRNNREQTFAVCGSCHARRAELTGDFHPGENFFDHYSLSIPDETDLFYPDGQIRDEDYEFTSFLGSRMHAAGVRCIDCHEPHSGKTRVAGNNLCLICHAGPAPPAPKIDAATHSHHKTGERGDLCVDCHMPQTTFMQRHARRDHGFTIPDPQLTIELKIPNACNRCHSDQSAEWSLAALGKWYGDKTNSPARWRTRVIARARAGKSESVPDLLRLLGGETNWLWKASSAQLLGQWVDQANVTAALLSSGADPHPLVRSRSLRALEPLAAAGQPPVLTLMHKSLNDPVRGVRIDAAWGLRATLDTNSLAGTDLLNYLRHNEDQPSGAMQLGVFYLDRGDVGRALTFLQRAVGWDTNSAPPRHALAIALSLEGRNEEAVQHLQAACRLAPTEAEYHYKLGLALNGVGKLQEARAALAQAVKLDPTIARAWYNLGLADSALGREESALDNLTRAESIDARSATIPYARATILARLGRIEEARMAARRALEIQPAYSDAANLLNRLR